MQLRDSSITLGTKDTKHLKSEIRNIRLDCLSRSPSLQSSSFSAIAGYCQSNLSFRISDLRCLVSLCPGIPSCSKFTLSFDLLQFFKQHRILRLVADRVNVDVSNDPFL